MGLKVEEREETNVYSIKKKLEGRQQKMKKIMNRNIE